jgi:hypothetical protein
MFKWWRKEAYSNPDHPKGYLLERIAGEVFDQGVRDHAAGFVALLRGIVERYQAFASAGLVPTLPDPGVPSQNVLRRITPEEFSAFIRRVKEARLVAEAALASPDKVESTNLWRKLFGQKFPSGSGGKAAFLGAPVVPPNRPAGFA